MKLLKMQQLDDDEDELAYTSTTSTKGGAGQLDIQKSSPLLFYSAQLSNL